MATFIRFKTPNGDSIALTGTESVNHVLDKGVMISSSQFEQSRAWIAEKNNSKALLIRDLLVEALNGDGDANANDYKNIDWKALFAELNKPTEPKKAQ